MSDGDVLGLFRCPECTNGPLELLDSFADLVCVGCNAIFPIVDGIPVLLRQSLGVRSRNSAPESMASSSDQAEDYKGRQVDYYRDKYLKEDWWFEADRPHNSGPAVEFVTYYPMNKLARSVSLGDLLNGSVVLNIGCGTGLEAEYFSRFGCDMIGLDFSLAQLRGAQERMRRRGFNMTLIAGDIMELPLVDSSVDYTLAYESLHHLPDPYEGFREMCRVARRGVILFEPRKSPLRQMALKLGIATHSEVVGNIVMDVDERELTSIGYEFDLKPFFIGRYVYKEFFRPPKLYQYFESDFPFFLFRAMFVVVNTILGPIGNKLTFVALKDSQGDSEK